ncbi:pyridoxal phosphate-dependent decarboxylase family protein, partial [Nocardioides sp. CER28]
VADALGRELPDGPTDPGEVVDLMAGACEAGLTAMPSGRFYGMVIGGSAPAALAADWLVAAWDQNSAMRALTPATAALEEVAAAWLLDLLGLPADAAVGFPTSATTANLTCLLAARDRVLREAGWDAATQGLTGAPRVRVLVGAEVHESVLYALRYLGLGAPETVPADRQGRLDPDALVAALRPGEPTIVVLQAGNVHSGAFDPFGPAIAAAQAAGAWVHVDGAFGLFAAAAPSLRHLTAGMEDADSWTTDAHKTLNVPYDCGIAVVRDAAALRAVTGKTGDYLPFGAVAEPTDRVPELSRRARGVPVWAVLRSLGRSGVADLLEGFCRHASLTCSRGSAATRPGSPTASARSRVPRSSTTSSTRRCAWRSATTSGRRPSPGRSSPTARLGCPARAGAAVRSSGSRSATGPPPTTTYAGPWTPSPERLRPSEP